ncbi:MAG: GAF domain-containing protein [Janthinobacterium lividum]
MEIIPTEKALNLSQDEVALLMDNFDDLHLWQQKFPPNSWIIKGFALLTLFDSTVENAVSALKGELLGAASPANDLKESLESIFRSLYQIPDLHIGFTAYNKEEHKFTVPAFKQHIKSYLLQNNSEEDCLLVMRKDSFKKIVEKRSYFSVSNSEKFLNQNPDSIIVRHFLTRNIQSFILAPIVKNDQLLGVLELVSNRPEELNSVNANRLEAVMPFLANTIDRQFTDMQNRVQALIQDEYTTIHPSVYWKFKKEALTALQYQQSGKEYTLKEVTFKDVYALYGQIDIKGSSEARNRSIQQDFQQQLKTLISLLNHLKNSSGNLIDLQKTKQLETLLMDVSITVQADTEQSIQNYLETQIHPILKQAFLLNSVFAEEINFYFKQSDPKTGDFHLHRRNYQTAVTSINEKMALVLDRWQQEAQTQFPHYYERFKTDGVEHNMYIGASITPSIRFEFSYLYNLRLWQLQVLCEMELEHHFLKPALPYPLEITSLVLAFSSPISIRFRMDEKRFDIDGTYNARFEIIKKRIDKAFIKGTQERITAVGKITIVYSSQEEREQYTQYIHFLQSKKMLSEQVEMLEVEDLQGIFGLKALRVNIIYNNSLPARKCYNYAELANTKISDIV